MARDSRHLPTMNNDLRTTQEMVLEYVQVHAQEVLYEIQDRANPLVDELHGEILSEDREYKAAVKLLTFVEVDPPQALLTKWGIDEERDLVLRPAVISLVEAGLAKFSREDDVTSRPIFFIGMGDRVTWDDTRYSVKEIVRERYWGNTNRPLWMRLTLSRRHENVEDFECDDVGSAQYPGGTGSIVPDDRC